MKVNKPYFHVSKTLAMVFLLPLIHSADVLAQVSMAECAQLEDSLERLRCYDSVMESSAMESSAPSSMPVIDVPRANPQGQSQPQPKPVTQSAPQDDFGKTVAMKDAVEETRSEEPGSLGLDDIDGTGELTQRVMTVAAAKQNDFTGWTIEFENGQVWQQIGTDGYRIRKGEQYTISKALMDSYLLSNSSNNRKMRVRRIK